MFGELEQLNARITRYEQLIESRNRRVSKQLTQLRSRLFERLASGARLAAIGAVTGLAAFIVGKLFGPSRSAGASPARPGLIAKALATIMPLIAPRIAQALIGMLLTVIGPLGMAVREGLDHRPPEP